jgi:diguanylate cyclase (GGDEF)-like protein
MKPLVLAPLLSQVVEGIGPYAEQLGVRLKIENRYPAAKVNADSERIMQVLTNLLSNAVKFSPRDDDVHILVSRNGSDIRIAVTDHGPGIPEDFRDRIFQQFAQADSSDRRGKGGTGLGLSISKKIIEKHGGEIGFHTEPGIDTTFYFELPELHEEEVLEPHFLGCQIVSSVDDLTGVLNRSCFEEQLNGEWRRALRNKTPLSMILVEIAHFDVYHTNYGKQSADQCLRLIAVALRKLMMRPGDVFARYGEMQFAALLPETGAKGAACIAEKMRSQVDELGIDFAHPEGSGKVTVIVGISTMIPGRESNPGMLLTAAGSALS